MRSRHRVPWSVDNTFFVQSIRKVTKNRMARYTNITIVNHRTTATPFNTAQIHFWLYNVRSILTTK